MKTLLSLGYAVFDGSTLMRCQFRLFLAHPLPHVWADDEYFHGGDFWFYPPDDTHQWDLSARGAKAYQQQVKERLYWGKAGIPDAALTELELQRSAVRTVTFDDGTSYRVWETYFDFEPQEPGLYRWRYTYDDALGGYSDDVTSEVCIESATANAHGKPTCPASAPIDD